MKKVEKDFLNDYSLKTGSLYDDIKEKIVIDYNPERRNNKILKLSIISLTCLLLMFSVGFGTYKITIEATEYKAAVDFFEENDLEIEGLTRSEIKKVYKDIKTNSFTYSKTEEVISNSISKKVPGYEISPTDPKISNVRDLWEYWDKISNGYYINGDEYKMEFRDAHYENGVLIPEVRNIVKYNDKNIVWKTDVVQYNVNEIKRFDDLLLVYSRTVWPDSTALTINQGQIIFLDVQTGAIIKVIDFSNSQKYEAIITILFNSDETYTLVSQIDCKDLCLMTFDLTGNIIEVLKEDYTGYNIKNATKFEDGYLLLLSDTNQKQKIVKTDCNGKVESGWSYEREGYIYNITSMIEFEGKIYLSTYFTPKRKPTNDVYSTSETYDIFQYVLDNHYSEGQDVTNLFREHYTASLLVCDSSTGMPSEFYSIRSALGGELHINDEGQLVWNVENISSVYLSLATSSFTFGGTCEVYEYMFNRSGIQNGIIDTKRVIIFRRL